MNYTVNSVNTHLAKKKNWCCMKMSSVFMLVKNVSLIPYFIDSKTFFPHSLTSLKLRCLVNWWWVSMIVSFFSFLECCKIMVYHRYDKIRECVFLCGKEEEMLWIAVYFLGYRIYCIKYYFYQALSWLWAVDSGPVIKIFHP